MGKIRLMCWVMEHEIAKHMPPQKPTNVFIKNINSHFDLPHCQNIKNIKKHCWWFEKHQFCVRKPNNHNVVEKHDEVCKTPEQTKAGVSNFY